PGTGWGDVLAAARQSDGKIVIAGFMQHGITRLNPDGSPDSAFNPGTGVGDNFVNSIALQTNGQIVIGGAFSSFAGVSRQNIARLNADGSLDLSFNPIMAQVQTILIQPDGKVLVASRTSGGVMRLKSDGTVDTGFNTALDTNSYVGSLALQPDGKLLVGGHVP